MKTIAKLLFMIALIAAISMIPATAYGADITVKLDGKTLSMSQSPQIVGGRVFVPFRAIAEALSATVNWEATTKTITMTKGSNKVELKVGSTSAKINGATKTLDAAPYVSNGSTYVPVRFVSDALGVTVNWDSASKTVLLTTGSSNNIKVSSADLKVKIEGKEWGLMQDGTPLIKLMGSNPKCVESVSCAYDGMDRLYSNADFSVSVLPINGKDTQIIDEIVLTSSKYATSKGIKVGSAKDDVISKYGSDYTTQGSTIIYWAGEKDGLKTPRIYFDLSGNSVESLGIYGARNAG